MANVIRHKRGTSDPVAGDFSGTAELLINTTDGGLFTKTDGGSVVEIGAGGGGGGLTYFTEAESTASPNNTVSVDSLTAAAATTNADVALVAKGTGATLAQVPDGTATGGNKRGQYATDLQKKRTTSGHVATGDYSVLLGGANNTVSGRYSLVCGGFAGSATGDYAAINGGRSNQATSNYAFVGGGQSNEAKTNTYSAVVGGKSNDATGQYSFVGGGESNVASGLRASVLGGASNYATGSESVVCGGDLNLANSSNSFIAGGRYGTTRSISGYHVFPAIDDAITQYGSGYGKAQSALLLLGRQTTDATATVIASTSSAAGTTNQVILPDNSAYAFKGTVIATVTGGGDTAAWELKGAIKRGANAASTAIVGTVVKDVLANDAGAASWDVTFTADTTNGGLKVEVTGAAATTIRWVAKLETTEVTY
jgi:hypothetical protein